MRIINHNIPSRLPGLFRTLSRHTKRMPAIICLTLAGIPAAHAQVNAEQVLSIGKNVLSMEDYMLSIQYFNQAIKAKPYLADPYFFRALAKLNLEDYQGAEEDCTLALERNKFKTEAYKLRGFARQNLGKDSLAIIDYDMGLDYNPTDKYFLFYKAVAQTELEKYHEADSTFRTLLRHYPRFDEGITAKARLNILRGDTVAALTDLDRALSISRSHVNAYLMRADIEARQKSWERALADMDQAIRLLPQEPDLYVNRAYLRYNTDDFFGAMSDYNYTLEIDPTNEAALFNRALLRYEVKDLNRAAADFTAVLKISPGNFHALYNRGLVYLELEEWRNALADFQHISQKYPKFYPVYYAIAECRKNLGDMRGAMEMAYKAEDLVKRYVHNPDKNPLDRPTIAAATSNSNGQRQGEDESEIDVMNRFNQLVTVNETSETQLSYNDRIKGRVQDRNVQVEPEPLYSISYFPPKTALRSQSNYFRELDDLNQGRYFPRQFHLVAGFPGGNTEEDMAGMFELAAKLSQNPVAARRPIDNFALGIAYTAIKNYPEAITALDAAIAADPKSATGYMARAYAYYGLATQRITASMSAGAEDAASEEAKESSALLERRTAMKEIEQALADYDMALSLNPRLVYAHFNRGYIYYQLQDFPSAAACFSAAITADPDFGEAYFNRGLAYLKTGNKQAAFTDLSKAGELGVLPSYNLLKRMK